MSPDNTWRFVRSLPLLLLMACGLDVSDGRPPVPAQPPVASGSFETLLNSARADAGVARVVVSPKLVAAAQRHADDMSAKGYLSHTGADGRKLRDRVRAAGYGYCWIAENIAHGQRTNAQVMSRWMASPGHRTNALDPRAKEFGLGRASSYWVLVLGRPGC